MHQSLKVSKSLIMLQLYKGEVVAILKINHPMNWLQNEVNYSQNDDLTKHAGYQQHCPILAVEQ